MSNTRWHKGQRVTKIFHGTDGYKETDEAVIHHIEKGVIYLDDGQGSFETGITYDLNGQEIERFFLPMFSEIRETP